MRAVDLIVKKRDRGEMTREEINFFVKGFTSGEIPDYQASAWAMAVLLNGMTPREITDLALAMAHSGEVLDMARFAKGIVVDKHSTGGVGDKTTLVVLPIVAACGLPAAKMSGRGLGFSGGTLDKLESFPGYRVNLTTEDFIRQLQEIGIVLSGQSRDLAPADGKFYALRDVTGTVQSLPLIASSIMSKKIAAGAQAILLDVKVGLGAFMKTLDEARALARMMISIGEMAGRRVVTVLSDMNQPLGQAVGNILEVREALETLHGGGPEDFREHCLHISSHMLVLGQIAQDLKNGRVLAEQAIVSGAAFQKLRQLVAAQGGEAAYVDDPGKFPTAKYIEPLPAERTGYLSQVNAQVIGEESVTLGAGRAKKNDPIDHTVGIIIHRRVGDRVARGETLATIHANDPATLSLVRERLQHAFAWSEAPVPPLPLFYE